MSPPEFIRRYLDRLADDIAFHSGRLDELRRELSDFEALPVEIPRADRELVCPKFAADLCGVSERTARRWAADPERGIRRGRTWWLFRDQLSVKAKAVSANGR